MDSLANDLETEMDAPTEPISPEEANLEQDLAAGNPEVADVQQQTMEDIKNEDQMLKDKIQARIETANQEIIGFAEKVEEFLSVLNDPSNPESIKYAIHKFGCCLLGFLITQEWYNVTFDNSEIKGIDSPILGGHAVLACGYNKFGVIIQNSWGEGWGEYGYAIVSWDAVRKYLQYGAVLTRSLDGLALPK